MLDQRFYWGTIRKAIVAFGNMFNNINIERRDSSGNIVQVLKVPLSYAGKAKALARIQQRPNVDDRNVQIIVPRMAFEMSTLTYDYNRKISPIQQSRSVNTTSTTLDSQYAPTPYNINILLYVYVKNQDDGLQIIEQILPYFNPDYNLTLKALPQLNIKNDLPIILDSVNFEDNYEGEFDDRRTIIWTLSFTMKLNFYGPVNKQGIIRKVVTSTYNDAALTQKTTITTVEPDPLTAKPGDDIGFTDTFEDFE
jgi:hypothetical protein